VGKISAVVVSALTMGLFYYIPTILNEIEIGFEMPLFGWVQVSQPFAELKEPTLIIGGILSVIMFFLLLSRGSHEVKTS